MLDLRARRVNHGAPSARTALIDQLGAVLTAEPGGSNLRESGVQDALNVVLAHIRAAGDSGEVDLGADRGLSRQIRALEGPLTRLLIQRLSTMEPALPTGEVLFTSAVDARLIVSIALRSYSG